MTGSEYSDVHISGDYRWVRFDGEQYTYADQQVPLNILGHASAPIATRSFMVAVDPRAEAALARDAGASQLADSLDHLTQMGTQSQYTAPRMEATIQGAFGWGSGSAIPALMAQGVTPDVTVEASTKNVKPRLLSGDELSAQKHDECTVETSIDPFSCARLSDQGVQTLERAEATSSFRTSNTVPTFPWVSVDLPFSTTAQGSQLPSVFTRSGSEGAGSLNGGLPMPLSRTPVGSGLSVNVSPMAAPVMAGPEWVMESYRPTGTAPRAYPALDPRSRIEDTYQPTSGAFLPGTSPLEASSLRTTRGRIAQTFDGTGAATSAAPALVDRAALATILQSDAASSGGAPLGATVVRLRLERPAPDQPPTRSTINRAVTAISTMGLHATVLVGASPVRVNVNLQGSTAGAWHGEATEDWSELGADVRVERATGWGLLFLPLLTVGTVLVLVVLTEIAASRRRVQSGTALACAGWTRPMVARRILGEILPGILIIAIASIAAGVITTTRHTSTSNAYICVAIAILYILGMITVGIRDTLTATRPLCVPQPSASTRIIARWRLHRACQHVVAMGPVRVGLRWSTPGQRPLVLATILAGVLAAVGADAISRLRDQAGSSALADAGMSLLQAASIALIALGLVAIMTILIAGMSQQLRTVRSRQQILSRSAWPTSSRMTAELTYWATRYLLATVIILAIAMVSAWVYAMVSHSPLHPWLAPVGLAAAVTIALDIAILGMTLLTAARANTPTSTSSPRPKMMRRHS